MAVNDPILDGIKKQIQEYITLPISENSNDKAIYELIASADINIGETVLTFTSMNIFDNYDIENMKLINRDTLEELSIDSFNLINKTITITEPLTSAVLQNDTFILNNRDHLIIQSMYATENNTEIDDLTRIRERFRFTLKVYGDEMKLKTSQYKRDLIRAFKQKSYPQIDENGDITKELIYKVDSLSFDPYVDLSDTCIICTGSIMVEYIMC